MTTENIFILEGKIAELQLQVKELKENVEVLEENQDRLMNIAIKDNL